MRVIGIMWVLIVLFHACGGGAPEPKKEDQQPITPIEEPSDFPDRKKFPETSQKPSSPFLFVIRKTWNLAIGNANRAAELLLSQEGITDAEENDDFVFAMMMAFFLDKQFTPKAHIYVRAHLARELAQKQYRYPLMIDNGCDRLIQTGVIGPGDPLFSSCSQNRERFPTTFFPFDGQFAPGSIFVAAGAKPKAQDPHASNKDPFQGKDGVAFSGVIAVSNVAPQAVPGHEKLVAAYLRAMNMKDTSECVDKIRKDANFVLLQVDAARFRTDHRPDLTPPYSPVLCRDPIDYITIAKNRLFLENGQRGCRHPNEVCGSARHVGPCQKSTHPHFDEVDGAGSLRAAFLLPALMVFVPEKRAWFAGPIDTFALPACGLSEGRFPTAKRKGPPLSSLTQ